MSLHSWSVLLTAMSLMIASLRKWIVLTRSIIEYGNTFFSDWYLFNELNDMQVFESLRSKMPTCTSLSTKFQRKRLDWWSLNPHSFFKKNRRWSSINSNQEHADAVSWTQFGSKRLVKLSIRNHSWLLNEDISTLFSRVVAFSFISNDIKQRISGRRRDAVVAYTKIRRPTLVRVTSEEKKKKNKNYKRRW